ncbi:MAG: hypothetical protein ACK5XN_18810 [Bacteroidota bacterium]
MENNSLLKVGDVVRLKLKPEVTGVINSFFNWGWDQFNTNHPKAKNIEADVLFLGDDLKTESKRFPVLMLEKV